MAAVMLRKLNTARVGSSNFKKAEERMGREHQTFEGCEHGEGLHHLDPDDVHWTVALRVKVIIISLYTFRKSFVTI